MRIFFRATFCVLLLTVAAAADDVRVIVGFKGQPDAEAVRKLGGGQMRSLLAGRTMVAVVPANAVSKLRADENVAYVEEDGIASTCGKPQGTTSQPAEQTPWGVTKVGAPLTGNVGAGIKVAIIDTGIDLDHPDLAGNIKGNVDFTGSTKGAEDENGHGSHVAGTVAAIDNTIGVIGVAPGASLYAVRVLDRRGSGWWSDIADGITWCKDHGMNVANMSLGGSSSVSIVESACNAAETAGVLLIAAAGNSGDGSTSTTETGYPAAYASVVAVGATDINDNLASFSNTGSYVEVSGPGVSVRSAYKGASYATLSGTSMASPHAAGMAALLWSQKTSLSLTANSGTVRTELRSRIRDLGAAGKDSGYGYGIVYYP